MRYWAFSIAILLLCPIAFGQAGIDPYDVTDFVDSLNVWSPIDSALCDTVIGWEDAIAWRQAQDSSKPECLNFIEIFYIDTVGWYLDTIVVEIPCPTLKYQEEGSYTGCLVMHTGLKIVWKPKIETKSIFKFEPSTFEHFERWKIRKK